MKQIKSIRRRITALALCSGYILASGYLLVPNIEYPTANQACCSVNSMASGSCCCCKTTIAPLSTSPCLMQAPCNSAPPDAAFSTTSDNKHLATTYTIAPAIINPYLASRDEAHAPYRPHNYPIEKIPITAV